MNSAIIPVEATSFPDGQWEFRGQIQAWRELLGHCGHRPGRKCVHDLRVATLRLQAGIEYWLSRQETGAAAAASAVRRWRRQGKKLRRALGPVRQEDVSLGKLLQVRAWAEPASAGSAVFAKECLGAIDEIERGVKRARDAAAKKLAAAIKQRRKRLNRLSKKLELALEELAPAKEVDIADRLLAQVAAVSADFPELDSENLHEFRKRLKKIRYLAEIFASRDAAAAHIAVTLKRMTGAVGEWHDWQTLTQEAARADRKDTGMASTAEFLQAQAGRTFDHAMKLCRQSMARLLSGGRPSGTTQSEPARESALQVPHKPVVPISLDLYQAQLEHPARYRAS